MRLVSCLLGEILEVQHHSSEYMDANWIESQSPAARQALCWPRVRDNNEEAAAILDPGACSL